MSIFKNNVFVGVTAGLIAAVLAPVLIPALKKSGRPLAKSLVKGGILLYDKGRGAVAGAGEALEDVIAEVHAETYEKQMVGAEAAQRAEGQPRGGNGLDEGGGTPGAALARREGGEVL